MRVQGFDWDNGNWPKCAKPGVTKNEIESLFDDDPNLYPDAKHSRDETRQLAIGRTRKGRWLLVAFTLRRRKRRRLIRPISARYMHRKEIEHYEQEKES
jgi:uncharacterized DUF497 family protein